MTAIGPDELQWNAPLPLNRTTAATPIKANSSDTSITYGDYFTAAKAWLLHNHLEIPRKALRHQLGQNLPSQDIQRIDIHLIKHGAFYHPAKVTLQLEDRQAQLVLNMAVGDQGKSLLRDEYACLARLNKIYKSAFIPQVYGCQEYADGGNSPTSMFAAQWLNGFHEFHLSQEMVWVLWDDDRGTIQLTASQIGEVFRQAAFILTHFYNPLTFESVGRWHHAAGDFVASIQDNRILVRLISVRRYAPYVKIGIKETPTIEMVLDGICLFLLDMSMRIRLDRMNGTGPLVLAPFADLKAVWKGFCQGLDSVCDQHALPPAFKQGALEYLRAHSQENLLQLGSRVLARYISAGTEAVLLQDALADHLSALMVAMQEPFLED